MSVAYKLDQLRRRVDRLDAEVQDTRQRIDGLARRVAAVAEPPSMPMPSVPPTATVPSVLPVPPAATPPPLPAPVLPPVPSPVPTVPSPTPPPLPAQRKMGLFPDEPPVATGSRPREPRADEAESALVDWLRQVHLWPPEGGENAESRLGAWWATRVGALLAVIGVVFFGVYVSLHTPSWVKFLELAALAAGVTALGAWLERRVPTFGTVVFGGGLALLYFTAYAGYAVPAVKVIDSPWAAAAWQAAAVAGMVAGALWRRSAAIATLAVGLGAVTALFSHHAGMPGLALPALSVLAVVAVALRRRLGWEGPSVLAMPAAYALVALVWRDAARLGAVPAAAWAALAVGGFALLFFLRDARRERVSAGAVSSGETWFQGLNSSIAALLAVSLGLMFYRPQLGLVYAGLAGLLGGMAWWRARQVERDPVGALLLAKTCGAATLAVIEFADARSTALALLVQASVMAWTARRLASRVLAIGAALVAALALGFQVRHGLAPTPVWSLPALQALLFSLGLAAFVDESLRHLSVAADDRRGLRIVGALAAGLPLVAAAWGWTPGAWTPVWLALASAAFAALAWARRGGAATGAAALTLAAGNIVYWSRAWDWPSSGGADLLLLGNATAVLAPTIALSWWLGRNEHRPREALAAGAVAAVGFVLGAHALLPATVAFAVVSVAALLLALAGRLAPRRELSGLATLALGLAGAGWIAGGWASSPAWALAVAAVSAWALPLARRWAAEHGVAMRAAGLLDAVPIALATALTMRGLAVGLDGEARVLGLAGAALAASLLAWRGGVRAATVGAWALAALAVPAVSDIGRTPDWIEILAMAGAWLLLWAPAALWSRLAADAPGRVRGATAVPAVLASAFSLLAVVSVFDGVARVWVLATVTLATAALHRAGVLRARAAASGLALITAFGGFGWIVSGGAEGWGAGLFAVAGLAAVVAAAPRWLARSAPVWSRETTRAVTWLGGAAGLGLWGLACLVQEAPLAAYATVGCGLGAALWFCAGLVWRAAPYRLLGLLGLGMCIPRVFIVDLQSTLHRIVAFIALGVALLWVGFSYHRFRHLVVEAPDDDRAGPDDHRQNG